MKTRKLECRVVVCAALLLSAGCVSAWAQKAAVPSRITEAVDDSRTVTLKGNVSPLARPQFDQGPVPDSQPMTRMMLLLQRSPAQELALQKLMDAQQTKGSGSYHAWLSPEQFGAQFGPADADVQTVTDWLTHEGFQVNKVSAGKTVIEFDGTAGQVRTAFHTEMHKFVVNGEEHMANVSDPSIPEALAPVVAGTVALHNFSKHPNIVKNGLYRREKGSNQLEPLFTYGNPAHYALGPGDFGKIYNIPSTATGAGKSIAIIAQTNINTQDVVDFRSMFGLPAYSSVCTSGLPPTCQFSVIINGVDPGIIGPNSVSCVGSTDDEVESDLDTEWSGALAPSANIYLVVSETTCANSNQISMGVDLSALYAVDNNVAPIISDSYGMCESMLGQAGNQFYSSLWEQAAAQGITVSVAAGDSGSAGCDPSADPDAATTGVAVNGLASTPYNTAMGGTDFDPSTTGNPAYWTSNSGGTDVVTSAIGYIPEITWDDSACALAFYTSGTPCTTVDTTYASDIAAGSGGPSNCISGSYNANTSVETCATVSGLYGYAKPSFQSGLTPADSLRDIPDVSFFGSNGGPLSGGTDVAYVICQSDTNPQNSSTPTGASCNITTPYEDFSLVGGTSAATPAFAAVMALVDQALGGRQGNANYVLYSLAAADTNYGSGKCATSTGGPNGTPVAPNAACVFNDVTKGTNTVACDAGTPNCTNTTTDTTGAYGVLSCNASSSSLTPVWQTCPADATSVAFQASAKYDLATGLGSINVGNLLAKWTSGTRTASTTTVVSTSGGTTAAVAFTATVTVAPSAATGDVSITALKADQTTVLGSFGPFALSGGSATASNVLLPVGTAYVEATYGGNATYGSSTSAPKAITAVGGAGYASKVTVNFVGYNANTGAINTPTTSSQNFPYGTPYILQIVVSESNGTSCAFSYPNTKPTNPTIPCPTGTITLTDGGSALNDFVNMTTNKTAINNLGIAEDQYIDLNAGSHSIVASYSGDGNYSAATSNTLKITVTQNPTTTGITSSLSTITSGQSVTLLATIEPNDASNGLAPCGVSGGGTVQFTNNGSNLSGTVTYTAVAPSFTNPSVACTASLQVAISSLYPPPTDKPGFPAVPRIPAFIAALSMLLLALGLRYLPQTRTRAYAYAGLLAIAVVVGVVAGCGGGSSSSSGSTRTVAANYSGNANYGKSSANTVIVIQQ
jgi:Pro-kumamolisin, activation domain/Bacterial Ig-like domain (group 3)